MNTKQLQYFVTVATQGSIAGAARELDIAQPAISQQIANLEHELRATLFVRDFKGVQLTESGERFMAHAQSIIRQIEQAKTDVNEVESNPKGRVAIGMNQAVGNAVSVPLLQAVKEKYPGIELDLYTALSYTLHDWLNRGEIDIALSYEDSSDMSSFNRIPLITEKIYLVTGKRPKNPAFEPLLSRKQISFAELADFEIMVTGRKEALGYLLSKYEVQTGVTLNKTNSYGQLMTTLRYVTEGYGLLAIPSSGVFHLEELGQLHSLEIIEPEIKRDVFIMNSVERPMGNAMRAVIDMVHKVTQAANREDHWRGYINTAGEN